MNMFKLLLAATLLPSLMLAQGNPTDELSIATRGTATALGIDFEAQLARANPNDRGVILASGERMQQLAEGILMNRQLANEARTAKLDADPVAQRELLLAAEGILARRAIENMMLKAERPRFEQLAKELFIADRDSYRQPDLAQVQHILIGNDKRSDAQALKLVLEVQAKLTADNFEEVALESSEDPSVAQNKGIFSLSSNETSAYDPAFFASSFLLKKPGDTTQPVRTQFGYHLIRLISREQGRVTEFEEVKDRLVEDLAAKWEERTRKELFEKYRAFATNVDQDAVEKLRDRFQLPSMLKPQAINPSTVPQAAPGSQ